jgi:glutamate synthase (NADPH/NADH) small chain
MPRIGGLLTFGIPPFKLEKEVVETRRELMEGMGVEFRLGVEVGRDVSIEQLIAEYDAVFLGMGAYKSVKGGFPGEDAARVSMRRCRISSPTSTDETRTVGRSSSISPGKRVVVLGGGDTWQWIATARPSARAPRASPAHTVATKTTCPARSRDYKNSAEEGVEFLFNRQPIEIVGNGRVEGVKRGRDAARSARAAGPSDSRAGAGQRAR